MSKPKIVLSRDGKIRLQRGQYGGIVIGEYWRSLNTGLWNGYINSTRKFLEDSPLKEDLRPAALAEVPNVIAFLREAMEE